MEEFEYNSDVGSGGDDIFLDTIPLDVELEVKKKSKGKKGSSSSANKKVTKPLISYTVDKKAVDAMMSKAVLGLDYDQKPAQEVMATSNRAKKKQRKVLRESTKGTPWFNMPATELTDENRRDLELLQMRAEIDPKSQYRRTDLKALPKYFQTGTIVDNPADYYSSRMTNKERKQTMVDELMDDYEFLAKNKKRYSDIKSREAQTRRRRVNPMKRFKKKTKE